MDNSPAPGKLFVAPGVLITVVKLAALGVPGVVRMSPVPGGVNDWLRLGASKGVRLETHGDSVSAEIYLVIDKEADSRVVARQVQQEVARAVTEIIGLDVEHVEVFVEDIQERSREAA